VERGRKEPSSELLNAICDALEVPLSSVLTDAGERMASEERAAHSEPTGEPTTVASGSTIDPGTKVVIPPVASLAVA
jgi:XRE family transcriptional regulator, stress-response regulator